MTLFTKPFVERRSPGRSLWLVTFTDIMALMLTFFVMLFSMAGPPMEPVWEGVRKTFSNELLSNKEGEWYSGPLDAPGMSTRTIPPGHLNLGYLEALLQEKINTEPTLMGVKLIVQKENLILSLPSDLFFAQGSATISARGKVRLLALADLLTHIGNRINLVGHTDPIEGTKESDVGSSHRVLSLARALAVARVLESAGCTAPLFVYGNGSGDYGPYDPAHAPSQARRMSAARRVDIVILGQGLE